MRTTHIALEIETEIEMNWHHYGVYFEEIHIRISSGPSDLENY